MATNWMETGPSSARIRTAPADHLAVLFADVVDSTLLYRRLGDLEGLRIVSGCLDALITLLPQHRGCRIKTVGDALMCLFPDAGSAIDAATGMQRLTTAMRPGGIALQIRVGLHCGPVIVQDGDIFGDTVNVAAYAANSAGPGQILVPASTATLLDPERRRHLRPRFESPLKKSLAGVPLWEMRWQTAEATANPAHGPGLVPARRRGRSGETPQAEVPRFLLARRPPEPAA